MRTLKANEIEVRVGQINEKGATLLLYKDARVDMVLLDELGKPWKREHQLIDGKLFCTVSVWNNEINQWESRQDVGTESNTEKEKGQASDSFKRACVNWGIGRELYSSPFIWISADKYTSFKNPKTGKLGTYDKFAVQKIAYDENREITELVIVNAKTGAIVFKSNNQAAPVTPAKPSPAKVDPLAAAKDELNKMLETYSYDNAVKKKMFISKVLDKSTVETVAEAEKVMEELSV